MCCKVLSGNKLDQFAYYLTKVMTILKWVRRSIGVAMEVGHMFNLTPSKLG